MGYSYPQYELPIETQNTITRLLKEIMREHFKDKDLKDITARPLRPDEINTALNTETRVYDTTKTNIGYENILGASSSFKVKTGSVYLILGWIVIDDPTASIGLDAVGRIKVQGVIRNEIALAPVNLQENNALLTLDQVIVVTEDTDVTIEFKTPSNATAHAIVYPLAFRIGPRAQLDVT